MPGFGPHLASRRRRNGGGTPAPSPTPTPTPTLAALSLAAPTIAENTAAGSVIGPIAGRTAGSTLSLLNDAGGHFAISGTNLLTGLVATNFEAATSHAITIRETLAGATNTPRDTVLAVAVTNVFEAPSLAALSLSALAYTAGTSASGAITGATNGSTVVASGLPTGLTVNGPARTWAWDGTGSTGSTTITLTETLADSANSPRASSVGVTVSASTGTPAPTTLPTVGTAPTAAYGVSRLVSGYSGSLYRLVRASDSATMDIAQDANGKANVAAVPAWIGASSAAVDLWYDQTGNGYHVEQTTAGNRPQWFAANAIRGHTPVMTGLSATGNFNANAYLTMPAGHSVQKRAFTAFNVSASGIGPANSFGLWSLGTVTDATTPGVYFSNSTYGNLSGFNAFADHAYLGYSPDVVSVASAATRKQRVHKRANTSAQGADLTVLGGRIGHATWTSSSACVAAHFAFVTYGAQLSDADTLLIEDALATIFSVNLSPDTQIVFSGDSITNGLTNGTFGRTLPVVVGPNLSRYAGMFNTGVAGDSMAGIYSARARDFNRYNAAVARNCIHVWGGTNSIGGLATTTFDTRLTTANTTSGSPTAVVADATSMAIGNYVGSTQFPAGTTVTNIAGTTITCSANATATATGAVFRTMDGALATSAALNIWTTALLPYIQAAVVAGFPASRIVVATTIPRFWASVSATAAYGYELCRQAYNAKILAEAGTEGYRVADYSSVAGLASGVANTPSSTYYGTDLVHLKAAGYVHIEPTATAALNLAIG